MIAPARMTARRSARVTASRAAANAPSSEESKPVSPVIAARSGRMIGNGRKLASSRLPRKQPRPQERRLAGAGCAKNDEKPRRRGLAQTAEPFKRLDDRHRRLLKMLAASSASAAAVRDTAAGWNHFPWRPGEIFGAETGFLKSMLEPLQALGRKGDVHLLLRDRQHRTQHDDRGRWRAARRPGAGKFLRQLFDRQLRSARRTIAYSGGAPESILAAPRRAEPCCRDQEQHRLAAVRRLVERALPSLAGRDAALRVEIEENVVLPAVTRQPIARRPPRHCWCSNGLQNARHADCLKETVPQSPA